MKTDKQKLFEAFEKVCKIKIIKEYYNDDEGSGYGDIEYKEGPGATDDEIQNTIKRFKQDQSRWEYGKEDFENLAIGENANIKNEYYPEWKKEDFSKVIDAMKM